MNKLMRLTEEQMIEIINNKDIHNCSEGQKEQILDFAFGPLYVASEDKSKKVKYDNNNK